MAAVPTVAPAPVTAVPVTVPVVAPAHFFRPETIDVCLRNNGGFRAVANSGLRRCNRRQRRRVRGRGQHGSAGSKSNGEF